jgi:tetratricopeptide (TPR) repeat protein
VLALLCAVMLMRAGVLGQSQPAELNRLAQAGETALDEQRFADAFDAFTRAAALAPQNAPLALSAGFAATMLGRSADARTWLERALTLDPRLVEASTLLGYVLYQQGKVAEAIAVYERAIGYAPQHAELRKTLDQWKRESKVENRFYEARSAHFTVMFEGPADDIAARRVVDVLEQAYLRIGGALSAYPDEPITVVLYTRQQFFDVTRSPGWAGGLYDGRIKVPVAGAAPRTEELRRVLDHEFAHALVASIGGPRVPIWLNEGLATALEPGGLEWSARVLEASKERLTLGRVQAGLDNLTDPQVALAYAQSAVAVKRLMDLRGTASITVLLSSLRQGTSIADAFQQAMSMRYDEFATRFER